jgi:hypothetical protein
MAQTPGTETLYPFTSTDRQAIPLDIADIRGCMRENFTSVSSSARTIPDEAEFLVFSATEDCYVGFDMTAVAEPAEGVFEPDIIFLFAGSTKVVSRKDYTTFAVIRAGNDDGKLILEAGRLWQEIRKTLSVTNQG